ncbi:TadE/TadG family type IV pilus assembly protein [Arthrobacter sp. MDT3-44]
MAILLPVLILLLLGMMEFGRALNTQATLNYAAREGVRVMAITKNVSDAKNKAAASAPTLNPGVNPADVLVVGTCPTGPASPSPSVTVTVNYQLTTLTGIAGPFAMKATGVMLCGG